MKNDENKNISVQKWTDELDAVIAAPEHHRVLLENERVRVLASHVKPGETVPVHTHSWASVVYVLNSSDFLRYDADGNLISDSRMMPAEIKDAEVMWLPPLNPHSIKNIGDTEIRVINFELKD